MKSSEEAIEKVMAGLREASALPGMERRVLEAIEDRALARSRSRGWWLRVTMTAEPVRRRSLGYGVALAGVLAVALAGTWGVRSGHAPASSRVRMAGAAARPRAASGLIAEDPQLPLPGSSRRAVWGPVATRAKLVRESDDRTQRETRLVSYPAPPMPLTEQERLLLRIVHAGDPVELAMLNPEMRARRDAQSETEFKKFFPPPTPIKETPDENK